MSLWKAILLVLNRYDYGLPIEYIVDEVNGDSCYSRNDGGSVTYDQVYQELNHPRFHDLFEKNTSSDPHIYRVRY